MIPKSFFHNTNGEFRTIVDSKLCFTFYSGRNLAIVHCSSKAVIIDRE